MNYECVNVWGRDEQNVCDPFWDVFSDKECVWGGEGEPSYPAG